MDIGQCFPSNKNMHNNYALIQEQKAFIINKNDKIEKVNMYR